MNIFLIIGFFLLKTATIMASDEIPVNQESSEFLSTQSASKLEINGSLDTKYLLLYSRKTSSLYNLQNFGQAKKSNDLSQFVLEPYLNGDYVTKDLGFHFKTHGTYINEQASNLDLFELYGTINARPTLTFSVGKKAYNWGKGYAFNPVGYVNPIKDSENPELLQAGLMSLAVDYTKSFDSDALRTLGLTFLMIPSSKIQNKYGEVSQTDFAAKAYFLAWDMDIDILGYKSLSNGNQLGLDFSKNILTNIEMHGEFSRFENVPKASIIQNTLNIRNGTGNSYLAGMRYLNSIETTVIAEYYHNGNGLSSDEFKQYIKYNNDTITSGQSASVQQALGTSTTYFQKSAIMRDYLYLKISQAEPFNWVYFTPSTFVLYNLNDQSFALGVPLSYKPFTNFELLAWPTFLVGSLGTQFGEKPFSHRMETWLRFYF